MPAFVARLYIVQNFFSLLYVFFSLANSTLSDTGCVGRVSSLLPSPSHLADANVPELYCRVEVRDLTLEFFSLVGNSCVLGERGEEACLKEEAAQ